MRGQAADGALALPLDREYHPAELGVVGAVQLSTQ
jgi:hypothetical protein